MSIIRKNKYSICRLLRIEDIDREDRPQLHVEFHNDDVNLQEFMSLLKNSVTSKIKRLEIEISKNRRDKDMVNYLTGRKECLLGVQSRIAQLPKGVQHV